MYKKYQVKSEVKESILKGIDRKDLVFFDFSSQTYSEIVSSSDEFYYKGNMYDLVELNKVGGHYHCWCWLDNEESELGRELSLLVTQAMGDDTENDEHKKKITDWFKLLFHHENFVWTITAIDSMRDQRTLYLLNDLFFCQPCLLLPPELKA